MDDGLKHNAMLGKGIADHSLSVVTNPELLQLVKGVGVLGLSQDRLLDTVSPEGLSGRLESYVLSTRSGFYRTVAFKTRRTRSLIRQNTKETIKEARKYLCLLENSGN